jgi:hypothetical protein
MQARKNEAALSARDVQRGKQLVADWHWYPEREFEGQMQMINWADPDYPPGMLIECGRLARLHFRAPRVTGETQVNARRRRDTTITLSRGTANKSHLAFDPEHSEQRLYICLPPEACAALKGRFWDENRAPARSLAEWAALAGGRHGKRAHAPAAEGGYPAVVAKPVGILTAVVYYTDKRDDGPSFYLHKLGEVTCNIPILSCDSRGRLWVCGGSYTAPTPGITD